MQTQTFSLWWLRMVTFLIAALAAASAAYWVLKWSASAPPNQTAALVFPSPAQTDSRALARLLGGGQTNSPTAQLGSAASHFKLTGVVANRNNQGYALISVDGKPAKPYRVGTQVNDTLLLQSVAPRNASLAASLDAPASVTLELPPLALSQGTGTGKGKLARSSSE
jgi:general secretion pathway protein C